MVQAPGSKDQSVITEEKPVSYLSEHRQNIKTAPADQHYVEDSNESSRRNSSICIAGYSIEIVTAIGKGTHRLLCLVDCPLVARADTDCGGANMGFCARLEPWWSVIDVYDSDFD